MSDIKSYTIFGPEKWESYFLDDISIYLQNKNYQVDIKTKMEFHLDITANHNNWYGVMRKNIICQNNNTKKFFVINHADQIDDIPEDIINHPLCVGILKCQYKQGRYDRWKHKVAPFTYGVKEKDKYFLLRDKIKKISIKSQKMYFKGNETGRKNILTRLADMEIINSDYGFRDGHGNRNLKIKQEEYLENIAESKLALSLPGVGNCCHRELEAFGVGVPVLMPVLINRYYNDLIPNVHYVAVNTSLIGKHKIKHYSEEEEKIFCCLIKQRYKEIINNDEFLNKISENALSWFDKNIVFPSNMILLEKILLEELDYQL